MAATRTVTSCGDSGPGTLRQALLDSASGDVITFSLTGLTPCTINLATPLPTFNGSLTITGPGAANLTLDGGDTEQIMSLSGATSDVSVSGITFKNGKAPDDGVAFRGGGISATIRSLSISDCVFDSNIAQSSTSARRATAAGLYMSVSQASTVSGSTFSSNSAQNTAGGGSAGGAALFISSSGGTVTVSNSSFPSNTASVTAAGGNAAGAAIETSTASPVVITGSTFTSNSVSAPLATGGGGAIYVTGGLTSSDNVFSTNSVSSRIADGGAIHASVSASSYAGDTFTGNSASSSNGDAHGGAVYANVGSVTISGVTTWTSNAVTASQDREAFGGAIAVVGQPLSLTGTVTFTANTATGSAGTSTDGGDARGGAIYSNSNVTVSGTSTFTNNAATGGNLALGSPTATGAAGQGVGGGISVEEPPGPPSPRVSVSISGATFSGNVAQGGSVSVMASPPPTRSAGVGAGGAVAARAGTVTVLNSTFSGNSAVAPAPVADVDSASGQGGAIELRNATATVKGSLFSGNQGLPVNSSSGGALNVSDAGALTVANSTARANSAQLGGVILTSIGSTASVVNSTMAANSATLGHIYAGSSTGSTITNTILADTGGDACYDLSGAGYPTTSTSLIETGTCGIDGGGNVSGDPLLGALAANGGPTQTMALGAGSPALLVANSTACQAAPVNGLDQRGVSRPVGRCDMGAFQRSEALPTPGGGGTGGGSGQPSDEVSSSPSTVSAPTPTLSTPACSVEGIAPALGNRSVRVSWQVVGRDCTSIATATPVTRTGVQGARQCSTAGSTCVIRDLVPGTRYTITVAVTDPAGLTMQSVMPGVFTAVRYQKVFTVVPFAPGSSRMTRADRHAIRLAIRGDVVSALVVGYADPASWRRSELARARAKAIDDVIERARPELRVPARSGALLNPRCASVNWRCAVLRVTKAVPS